MLGPQVGLQSSLKNFRGLLVTYFACSMVECRMHADIVIFLMV